MRKKPAGRPTNEQTQAVREARDEIEWRLHHIAEALNAESVSVRLSISPPEPNMGITDNLIDVLVVVDGAERSLVSRSSWMADALRRAEEKARSLIAAAGLPPA